MTTFSEAIREAENAARSEGFQNGLNAAADLVRDRYKEDWIAGVIRTIEEHRIEGTET